jgi:putative ABC transport system permease protein
VQSVAVDSNRLVTVTSGTKSYSQVELTALADDEQLRWQKLSVGVLPQGPHQALAYVGSNFAIGQRLYVRPDVDTATDRTAVDMTVVGLVERGGVAPGVPQLYAPGSAVSAVDSGRSDSPDDVVIRLAFTEGAATATVLAAVQQLVSTVPGAEAMSGEAAADRLVERFTGGSEVLASVLLVFAAITVLVSCLVIANTFAVLITSRTKDLALLRCIGADASQVRSGVRIEALVLGLVASVAGVVFGIGGIALATWVVRMTGAGIPLTDLDIPVSALLVPVVLGVVMTVVAATVPARLATRVSPLSAFVTVAAPTSPGRNMVRIVAAVLLVAAGASIMIWGIAQKSVIPAGFGGGLTFLGVMLCGVVLVPPLVRTTGKLIARLLRRTAAGPVAELTGANAGRAPRRTAATASALIIGITLTTMMVVGAQVVRSSVTALISDLHPVDLIVSSGSPLPASLVDSIRNADGVAAAVPVTRTGIDVNGVAMNVAAVDTNSLRSVMRSGAAPAADEISLASEDQALAGVSDGERVTVLAGGMTKTMTVVDGDAGSFADRASVGGAPDPTGMAIRLSAFGTDSEHTVTALRDLVAASVPDATFAGGVQTQQQLDQILTLLLRIVLALLGVAVVVALIGVGNTMALSVIDRGRENALLRVIGLSSRGVRAMLLGEATIIAAVASVVGVALGTTYGVAGAAAIVGADRVSVPDLPWIELVGIVVIGGLSGLISAALPARRALRADPAAAL